MDFHIAGALELLEYDFVHAAAGFDQSGCDYGKASAALDIARRAEEALGLKQRRGIQTARQRAPGRRHDEVIRARQSRERIQQHHNVLTMLDQTLGALQYDFSHSSVVFGLLVECRVYHVALDRALHICYFLGALVNQQHDKLYVGIVLGDGVRNFFEQHGLAGLGRRDYQTALALANGRDHVDAAYRKIGRVVFVFQLNPFLRVYRG